MNSKNKIIDLLFRNNTFGGSFAISVVLNAALLAVALKVGVLPKVVMSKTDSMAVTVSDIFTITPPPARPSEAPVVPSFGMKDVPVPSASSSTAGPAEIVSSPNSPLNFSAPSPQVIPPSPIPVAAPSAAMPVSGTLGNSRGSGSGTVLPGGGYTSKNMIGGLDIAEKKLMIVTSKIDGPGPLGMLPDEYKKSIKTREGAYVLDVTEGISGVNVATFDEQFVSKVIAAAERTKPEAIYWLHFTWNSEHDPTIDRLISWLEQSGIPLYISSWLRPPSQRLQSAVQASGGEYEQRYRISHPPVVIRTTPEGTDYIKKSLKQKNQWNPNMQEEKDLWRGYLVGLIDRPPGKTADLGKTLQSRGVHFSVLGSSGDLALVKEQITKVSWESLAESWQKQRGGWRRGDVMIIVPRGSPTGSYIVKKDPKTGQWVRQISPTLDDLVDK